MLTAEEIARAKAAVPPLPGAKHEHDDCIRIAYEWLDAQEKTKGVLKSHFALKHIIEGWAERYVSMSDVIVAASMHPDIHGRYPYFNISKRLTLPHKRRLVGIGEAGKHPDYGRRQGRGSVYKREED